MRAGGAQRVGAQRAGGQWQGGQEQRLGRGGRGGASGNGCRRTWWCMWGMETQGAGGGANPLAGGQGGGGGGERGGGQPQVGVGGGGLSICCCLLLLRAAAGVGRLLHLQCRSCMLRGGGGCCSVWHTHCSVCARGRVFAAWLGCLSSRPACWSKQAPPAPLRSPPQSPLTSSHSTPWPNHRPLDSEMGSLLGSDRHSMDGVSPADFQEIEVGALPARL